MTTPQDPFASPANQPAQPPAGHETPSPPPPGVLPGAAPSTPPPLGGTPAGWAPEPPRGLATAAIVLTGLVALLSLVSVFTAPAEVRAIQEAVDSGDPPSTTNPLSLISFPILLGAFVVLALWMSKIRNNLKARGVTVGGPPAVEWWGWFVPLAHFVLPYLGMKAIANRKVGTGLLLGWWLAWCGYWIVSFGTIVPTVQGIDWSTGEISNPAAFDILVPLAYVGTVLTIVAWGFLAAIIRGVTARHLED